MFTRPDFSTAVSDIQTLLADTVPATAELDEAARSRLARIRRDVTARHPATARRRPWWPGRPQRQRRRVVISCIAVPAVLAGTAAGWAIASSPPASRVTALVVCYSLPHLPERGISESATGGTSDGVSPTALCAGQWAAGHVVSGVHKVPARLVACADPSLGDVAVFPDTSCTALHLPPLPPGYAQAARRFSALATALTDGLTGRCAGKTAVLSFTRRTARSRGFGSWRIIPPPAASTGPACWQAQPDPAAHTIQIVPQPGVYPAAQARAEQVIRSALSVSTGACRSGSTPQDAAATIQKLRAALRRAGYGTWKITLPQRATRQLPCYEQVQYPFGDHAVLLSPVAFPGSTY